MNNLRFRLSRISLQSRFFATTVSSPAFHQHAAASHLIEIYKLPPESAVAISAKLKLNDKKLANSDSIVSVLKDYGFSEAQIAQIILKRPSTLASRVSTLSPKLQFIQENGFVGNDLTELIVRCPAILGKGLEYDLRPCVNFLKKVLGTDDKVVAAVRRSTQVLSYQLCINMQPNIDLMVAQGVLFNTLSNFILKQPRTLLQKPERVAHAISKVNVLGIEPSSPMYAHAVRAVLSMSQANWDKKMEFFKSLGWSDEDIASVFTHYPLCLSSSEEKIRASWDFFINEVMYERSTIVANPKFLMYALDTRVRPRFMVFKTLKSLGLVSKKLRFSYMLNMSSNDFFERFIMPNQKLVPQLMDIYRCTAPDMILNGKNA